ncbi:pectate lyase [Clostridium cellulovorans]|uniref:Pectate lyase n=2 Tax=Clostridium cellulovorans TaxID=1493 RepID=D9STR9_CLOC7|nr:pectate lyase [Clostridium cellulovorans]ADL52803.1 pectate lyase [Clostridium cellulovorans 743B]BAV13172.1 pectate lyase [Clostridium cellulovorans]
MLNMKLKSRLKAMSFALACTFILSGAGVVLQHPEIAVAANSSASTASVSDILKYQNADGGWSKGYNTATGDWKNSTIDNGYTYSEIKRLASEYVKTKNSTYSAAAIKGINCLLNMQYSNGGWPQIAKSEGYHKHITYNDNAMINVMYLLDEVANKKGNFSFVDSNLANRCKTAVSKGVDCILKTQVIANGKLTVWGQQHDENTLKPTNARAYEVPSLCSSESVGIINFLKTRPSTPQIAASIKAATDWFKATGITGIKVVKQNNDVVVISDSSVKTPIWARFYEIGTNKPIFVGRDGKVKYRLADIDQERRTGYAWYGSWGSSLVK